MTPSGAADAIQGAYHLPWFQGCCEPWKIDLWSHEESHLEVLRGLNAHEKQ
jgi:hypothetical protein